MGANDPRADRTNIEAHRARLRFRLRLDRAGRHLHTLGPRAVVEALVDLADHTNDPGLVLATVAAYERLTPPMIRASGADRMPPRPLRQVQP